MFVVGECRCPGRNLSEFVHFTQRAHSVCNAAIGRRWWDLGKGIGQDSYYVTEGKRLYEEEKRPHFAREQCEGE